MNDAMVPMPGEDGDEETDEATHTLLAGLIASVHAQTDAWLAEQRALALRPPATTDRESARAAETHDPETTPERRSDDGAISADEQADPSGLAAIGFGPGMRLRLDQAGVPSRAALAEASPALLARALGDAIALATIEHWISLARADIGREA